MATVLDRVPLDAVEAEARQIGFQRTVLTLITGVFVLIGWLAYQPWRAFAWCVAAMKVGWKQAQQPCPGRPPDGPG